MSLLIGGGLAATIYKQQNPELYGDSTYSARMQNIRDQYLAFVARANERAAKISRDRARSKTTANQNTNLSNGTTNGPSFSFRDLLSSEGGAFLVGLALIGMSGFRG